MTEKYAIENEMEMNYKEIKLMLFDPCKSIDFMPAMKVGFDVLEVVNEMCRLGVKIRSDLKWSKNIEDVVKRASKKLWILWRLNGLGDQKLVDMYIEHCRSILAGKHHRC